jgi:transcriptional regulator with XRE-family HTH domain
MNHSEKNRKTDPKFVRAFERGVLRSAFVSLFWGIIQERKKAGTFTLLALAKALTTNKAEVSRWFKGDPNWTVNTIASLANALNVDIEIKARDRVTGMVFTPAGVQPIYVTAISQPAPITKSAPIARPLTLTHVPSDTSSNVFSFGSAA